MEDKKDAIVQNNEEDIQYTFVVPKGEVYREPDPEESEPEQSPAERVEPVPEVSDAEPSLDVTEEPEAAEEPEPEESDAEPVPAAKTIVADRRQFYDAEEKFFEAYKAADPTGRTAYMEPPVYDETGLSEVEDITYTFVVPKGEKYEEPDPEEEKAART